MEGTTDAFKAIALADDFAIIRSVEYLHQRLITAVSPALGELAAAVQDSDALSTDAKSVFASLIDVEAEEMREDQSVAAARRLLVVTAETTGGAALVLDCLATWPDDRKSVGKTLSFGLVASVLLLICSTKVTIKNGHLAIEKQPIVLQRVEVTSKEIGLSVSIATAAASKSGEPRKHKHPTTEAVPKSKQPGRALEPPSTDCKEPPDMADKK